MCFCVDFTISAVVTSVVGIQQKSFDTHRNSIDWKIKVTLQGGTHHFFLYLYLDAGWPHHIIAGSNISYPLIKTTNTTIFVIANNNRIQLHLFQATSVSVVDISGGCGAMYEIFVESNEFKGMPRVKQHQMVTETLKDEIKNMHGIRIQTAISDET